MTRQASTARTMALVTLVFAVLGLPCHAAAQWAQRSSIEGVVTDQQGGVVVGAAVTLRSDRLLGGAQVATTDGQGRYRFSRLLPGSYALTASAAGFAESHRGDVELPVETSYAVNFSLDVPALTARVEVAARNALIDVHSPASPTIRDEEMLFDVPTRRTLQSVLSLTPGVTTTTPLFGYVGEVSFGGTQGSNGISVDGVSLTEAWGGDQWSQVNYNWLEQVQVVGLGAPAEYGSSTGATVNGILRSGSNRVHGMAEWLTIRPKWRGDNLSDYPKDVDKPFPPRAILRWWDLNGQAGAPIVSDRLWLFTGASILRHDSRESGFDGPGSTEESTHRLIAKIDAAATNRLTLQGFVTRDASDVIGARLSQYTASAEASPDLFTRTRAWNARATATLSADTVAELRLSGHAGTSDYLPHPPATREGPLSQQDWATGLACCNSFWREESRSSFVLAGAVTHHRDGPHGRHDIRAGMEFERAPVESASGTPGGRRLYTVNGVLEAYEDWAGDHSQSKARRMTAYVQDRWQVHQRITVEPGVRVEVNRGSVPGIQDSFATTAVAPRLGAAWDIAGHQTTVMRAHYGRYHDPLYTTIYSYAQPDATTRHTYYDRFGQELFSYIEAVNLPGPSGLKASHVDQWVIGLERALGTHATVQAQYTGRHFGNFIGWIDLRIDDWTSYVVRDPGVDGEPGNVDDGETFTVYQPYGNGNDVSSRALELGNPEGASRRYDALQLVARRRFADDWQYEISYTWSRSTGTVGNEYRTNATYFDMNPGGVGANPGRRNAPPQKPRYDYSEFKALGSYRAPVLGGLTIGGVFRWHSGTNWNRVARVAAPINTIFAVEPVGTRRTPSLGGLDLRLEKTFRISRHGTAGLYVDAFNVTNLGRATSYEALSGPQFGQVSGWTDPRTMQLGLRYSF
jgi:hypothetical protein